MNATGLGASAACVAAMVSLSGWSRRLYTSTNSVEVLRAPAVACFVGRDVHVVEPQFATFGFGIGLPQVDLACPNGFDFGSGEHQPGLHRVPDEIVVVGLVVDGDDLDGVALGLSVGGFWLSHKCYLSAQVPSLLKT